MIKIYKVCVENSAMYSLFLTLEEAEACAAARILKTGRHYRIESVTAYV